MKILMTTILLSLAFIGFSQSKTKSIEISAKVQTSIVGEWEFHEITMRTPRDGYLIHIAEQEINIMHLLVCNYTFNSDGSIVLDPKYMEKQRVEKAEWKLTDTGDLAITYFWNEEKIKKDKLSSSSETMEYTITITASKELSLNLQDMFIVNLVR